MSGNNDDSPEQGSTGGGQGGQQNAPSQEPPAGQSQPAGGQPAGGQPAGGQPAGGQPQGGYQAAGGHAPAHREGIGDIFSKPTTMNQIKSTLVFFALAGVGVGLAGFMYVNQYLSSSGSGSGFFSGMGSVGIMSVPYLFGPVIAVAAGLHVVNSLKDVEADNLIFATAGTGALVGNVIYLLLFRMLIALEIEGPIEFGEFFITGIVGGIGAAVVAIGAAYMVLNSRR